MILSSCMDADEPAARNTDDTVGTLISSSSIFAATNSDPMASSDNAVGTSTPAKLIGCCETQGLFRVDVTVAESRTSKQQSGRNLVIFDFLRNKNYHVSREARGMDSQHPPWHIQHTERVHAIELQVS